MKISCIYAIINNLNGMMYIGKTVNLYNRLNYYKNNHHKDQIKLYNATQKYGWKNFSIEIIEICDSNLCEKERQWIKYLNTYDIYNDKMRL